MQTSTIHTIPFEIGHLSLWDTGDNLYDSFFVSYVQQVRDHDTMFTAFEDHEILLGIGGIDTIWVDKYGGKYGDAWIKLAIEPVDKSLCAIRIFYAFRKLLKENSFRRVQALVEKDFGVGNCLAKLLGFNQEGIVKCAPPNGNDSILYGMVF